MSDAPGEDGAGPGQRGQRRQHDPGEQGDADQRDPGLQPERTALAWRRTALVFVVGALLSMRLLAPVLGIWAGVTGAAGIGVGVWVAVVAHRRFARSGSQGLDSVRADGSAGALISGAVLVAALLCLFFVLAP